MTTSLLERGGPCRPWPQAFSLALLIELARTMEEAQAQNPLCVLRGFHPTTQHGRAIRLGHRRARENRPNGGLNLSSSSRHALGHW
jgi:hypothetical protein